MAFSDFKAISDAQERFGIKHLVLLTQSTINMKRL